MDETAALLKQHEKLIYHLADTFKVPRHDFEDLLQEGKMAFIQCAKKWDPSQETSLWTFARPRVFGAMCDAVTRQIQNPAAPNSSADEVLSLDELDPNPSPEDIFLDKEENQSVRRAVAKLSVADRELLTLWMNSASLEELGAKLHIARNSALYRVQHMIERLKDNLKKVA